jgi:hypothetical protein
MGDEDSVAHYVLLDEMRFPDELWMASREELNAYVVFFLFFFFWVLIDDRVDMSGQASIRLCRFIFNNGGRHDGSIDATKKILYNVLV